MLFSDAFTDFCDFVHFIAAKELRFRILRNIGNAFVKLGQFQDAIDNYELVMAGSADHQTAFNLLLCLYARGDKEKTKKHFTKMISIPVQGNCHMFALR